MIEFEEWREKHENVKTDFKTILMAIHYWLHWLQQMSDIIINARFEVFKQELKH